MQERKTVCIVGAGITGLFAAHKLREAGVRDVVIAEASDRVGGRIRDITGLAPWPVQLGPEFVHGSTCLFKDMLDLMGWELTEYEWPDYWYFPKERRLLNPEEGEKDPDLQRVHELFDGAEDEREPPPGRDVNAVDWLKSKGANPRMLEIAEACYANDFGCSLRQLGLREMIVENKRWDSGESYLVPDRSYSEMIDAMAKNLDIRLSTPVERVEYGQPGSPVRLQIKGGGEIVADRVILTASVAVLRSGVIQFSPILPADKRSAMARIGFGNAVKVILGFKEPFWPEKMYDIIIPGGFIPELWMVPFRVTEPNAACRCAMTCFFAGEKAGAVGKMSPQELVRRCLEEVDEIFATREDPKPATGRLVKSHVANWAKEPYILGAYTYPTHGVEKGDREALAKPVSGRLFFAGEATHPGVNPCVQGAMETAVRAAAQVAASLNGSRL